MSKNMTEFVVYAFFIICNTSEFYHYNLQKLVHDNDVSSNGQVLPYLLAGRTSTPIINVWMFYNAWTVSLGK